MRPIAAVTVLGAVYLSGCGPDETPVQALPPIFDPNDVERSFVEVAPCRHSHEHDLRHVVIYADPDSAEIFRDCVLRGGPACRHASFPEGALFVKYEYDLEGCVAEDLVSYTAALRLAEGSSRRGHDWRWQRTTPKLEVTSDGAPAVCLNCHIDHCSPPNGFDLRCRPD